MRPTWTTLLLLTLCACNSPVGRLGRETDAPAHVPQTARSIKALVIGINNYPYLENLHNSVNDALDFADMLVEKAGVPRGNVRVLTAEVGRRLITREALQQAVDDFYRDLREGDTAIFFYSGHGLQLVNDPSPNFLVPSDLRATTLAFDVREKAYPLSRVINLMEDKKAGLRLLFVDACRNNPWIEEQRRGNKGMNERAADTFHAPQNLIGGTVIGYAVSPGQKAMDHSPNGRNGMYTYYLLQNLPRPGVDVIDALRDLASQVYKESGQSMTPSYYGNLLARVSLVAGEAATSVPTSAAVVDRRVGRDGLTYRRLPAAKFRMGCSPGDSDCDYDEKPARDVTLTKPFWIAQTETTVEAYRLYAEATGAGMPPEPLWNARALNPGWREGKVPIVNVTWREAKSFCEWMGGRLPTHAEWEYAARGGSGGSRYGELGGVAWYGDNSGNGPLDTAGLYAKGTNYFYAKLYENGNGFHRVGLKAPNEFGLFDMLGNAWEWVADYYVEKYDYASELSDPHGPASGRYRILRGGSFDAPARDARASGLGWSDPNNRDFTIGFRCAAD
jgi:formylglycine-generating enzyme required for sulfatase activity